MQNFYKILVADDKPENVQRLTEWLRRESFVVTTAADGAEVLEKARSETPDLILMDRALPTLSGEIAALELKRDSRLMTIPIILLTNGGGPPAAAELLEKGADDLISDPTNFEEVNSRVRTMLKKRDVYLQLERAKLELHEANLKLKRLIVVDEMTELCNHNTFAKRLGEEFRRAKRYRQHLSLIMFDLDNFKSVNDRFGHPVGDEVLREFGQILKTRCRETDLVARYGGDEFTVVLPETPGPPANRLAERIRRSLDGRILDLGGHEISVTCSQGIATYPTNTTISDHDDLVRLADRALYVAKEAGKNRTVIDPQSFRSRD